MRLRFPICVKTCLGLGQLRVSRFRTTACYRAIPGRISLWIEPPQQQRRLDNA